MLPINLPFPKLLLRLSWLPLPLLMVACGPKETTIQPEYKPMIEAVYASGTVRPQNEYTVYALSEGYLRDRHVREGDEVQAQQALFQVDNTDQGVKVQKALTAYQLAQTNASKQSPVLEELEASLASASARLRNDSTNYVRFRNLLDNRATSQAEFDRTQLAYGTSQNEYRALRSRYERLRDLVRLELQNARGQYQLSTNEQARYQIVSVRNGTVYEVYKEPGELVRRNEAIALIGDKDRHVVQLLIDELDINRVQVGQPVEVKLDVYPNERFQASITKIYPMLSQRDNAFRVDAEFEHQPRQLFAGLSAEANIIISQKDRTLTIPKTYLVHGDSVRVKEGNETKTLKIRKGVETLQHVEVLEGVSEGQTLVMP